MKPFSLVRLCLTVCGLIALSLVAGAHAATTDLLQYKWQSYIASAPEKTTATLVQDKEGIAFTVKNLADNRVDTGPHLNVSLGGARDWRGFQTLHCRMRLTSDVPAVVAGGKDLTFSFGDEKTRRELQDIPVQQNIVYHLKGGDWQEFTLNLRPLGRAAITGVDLWTRILPYSLTHEYKIEIAKCEVVQADGPVFDGEGMSDAFPGGGGSAAKPLATGDGLQLRLAADGGVAGLGIGDQEIGSTTAAGGVLVRDHASQAPPTPAGGRLTPDGNGAVEVSDLPKLNLHFENHYQVEGNRIHVSIHAANLTKETRLLTLYFALPVQKKAWSWGRDINRSEAIPADSTRPYDDNTVQYPLATLTTPEAGVAVALPLDQPRNYRLAYNEQNGIFYAAFDVALADITTAAGKSLNEADCDVYLYQIDPAWGFRSALQAYYAAFPQWFVKQVKRDGGWDAERCRVPGYPNEELLASGCRFAWEQQPDDEAVWQSKNGILNTIYICPQYLGLSMTEFHAVSYDLALDRLKKTAAGDDAEWEKLKQSSYTMGYASRPYAKEHGVKAYHQLLAQSGLASSIYTEDGTIPLDLEDTDWMGGYGLSVSCNLEPQIPNGRGQAAFTLLDSEATGYTEKGLQPDGWALDCYTCDDVYDYRAENFRYASLPLTFAPDHAQPAAMMRLTSAVWIRALAERSHPKGQIVFPNLIGNYTFSAPYTDVFGTEGGNVEDPAYMRAMAYRRPVTYLPYTPKPDADTFFNFLYGAYPGRGLVQAQYVAMVPLLDQLTAAGWEPLTYATSDAPKLRIERFGSGDHCYLVFYNADAQAVRVHVTVDGAKLGHPFQKATVLFGPQKDKEIPLAEGGIFPLQMAGRQTWVVRLE